MGLSIDQLAQETNAAYNAARQHHLDDPDNNKDHKDAPVTLVVDGNEYQIDSVTFDPEAGVVIEAK